MVETAVTTGWLLDGLAIMRRLRLRRRPILVVAAASGGRVATRRLGKDNAGLGVLFNDSVS